MLITRDLKVEVTQPFALLTCSKYQNHALKSDIVKTVPINHWYLNVISCLRATAQWGTYESFRAPEPNMSFGLCFVSFGNNVQVQPRTHFL